MIGAKDLDSVEVVHSATEPADRGVAAQQVLRGHRPRQQMNSGWMISNWRSRNSRQAAASTGSGLRLPGGRQRRMFKM